MAARKKQYIRAECAHPSHHRVSPRRHLFRRFAAGAAVTEQLPIRALGMDLGRGQTLILAVIPFDEIAIDLRDVPKSREFAGATRALQRARKHPGEIHPS